MVLSLLIIDWLFIPSKSALFSLAGCLYFRAILPVWVLILRWLHFFFSFLLLFKGYLFVLDPELLIFRLRFPFCFLLAFLLGYLLEACLTFTAEHTRASILQWPSESKIFKNFTLLVVLLLCWLFLLFWWFLFSVGLNYIWFLFFSLLCCSPVSVFSRCHYECIISTCLSCLF